MTKELVKRENGHKIIKHARHERVHSLSYSTGIKMKYTTACSVILFLAVATAPSSGYAESISNIEVKGTTESSLPKSSDEKSAATIYAKPSSTKIQNRKKNDEDDLAPDKDMSVDEILLLQSLLNGENKLTGESNQNDSGINGVEDNDKTDNIVNNPENPVESKISTDLIDVRGQEDENSEVKQEKSSPAIQFDDSNTEVTSDPPLRFGQRSRKPKQKFQDGAPVLQLTEGGYERPFKRARFRNRYRSRPDSSEQSESVEQPERTLNNRVPGIRRIVPQVTYSPAPEPPYGFGQGPILNPGFDASARNMMAINHILPPTPQNGFLSSPSAGFTGYSTTAFQPQFSENSDAGSFPNFVRNLNNVPMYQSLPSNSLQPPEILFQTPPQVQTQPAIIEARRNVQPQFQQNPLTSYPGFETMEDNSTPNYATFFRNPAVNVPFQIPSNFYNNVPNTINAFNNPPVSFVSNYPNFDNRIPSQLFGYPTTTQTQNNQITSNNQQLDSGAFQTENEGKVEIQNADNAANRDDMSSTPFGTRLQAENVADVYMRYPTAEAGYAIEENLPSQNNSTELKEDNQKLSVEQTNFPNVDPYKNALNSVRNIQRSNDSFDFPPELFRNVPIVFRYQRPQSGIFTQYPDRNTGVPRYPNRNFESGNPFIPRTSLPENYHFLNEANQRLQQEDNKTPSCAKENNASVCFEDNDYPINDISYSLSSNSFLIDKFVDSEPAVKSFVFVERNDTVTDQSEETYACKVNTKYGLPLRAKNFAGMWRIIVNDGRTISQPLRIEVCESLGDSCNYANTQTKTSCVQKYSIQRLLTWSPSRGIYSDIYKVPVACSCQIIDVAQT